MTAMGRDGRGREDGRPCGTLMHAASAGDEKQWGCHLRPGPTAWTSPQEGDIWHMSMPARAAWGERGEGSEAFALSSAPQTVPGGGAAAETRP